MQVYSSSAEKDFDHGEVSKPWSQQLEIHQQDKFPAGKFPGMCFGDSDDRWT